MGNKNSRKVCKNELNNSKSETSREFTSSHIIFDYLEECWIVSLECEKGSHECHHLDVDYYFRCQLLEDEPEFHDIQSSESVGSIFKQSFRFNKSKTSSTECSLNHKVHLNYQNINLFHSEYQDDFTTAEEDDDLITLVTKNFIDVNDSCIIEKIIKIVINDFLKHAHNIT